MQPITAIGNSSELVRLYVALASRMISDALTKIMPNAMAAFRIRSRELKKLSRWAKEAVNLRFHVCDLFVFEDLAVC